MTKHDNLEILDRAYHEAAIEDATHAETTPADRVWADSVRLRTQDRLAAIRRNLLPSIDTPGVASPIRPSILAMTRDAVLARIAELAQRLAGDIQIAHRGLTGLTDDDLRQLLEALESE